MPKEHRALDGLNWQPQEGEDSCPAGLDLVQVEEKRWDSVASVHLVQILPVVVNVGFVVPAGTIWDNLPRQNQCS